MKVISKEREKTTAEDIEQGECCRMEDKVWMRTKGNLRKWSNQEWVSFVDIETGDENGFLPDKPAEPVGATVTLQEKL